MTRRKWTKKEIGEYRKIHSGIFYYNKEDSNFFVPKQYSIGVAFNWANPIAWIFILIVIAIVVWSVFFK